MLFDLKLGTAIFLFTHPITQVLFLTQYEYLA